MVYQLSTLSRVDLRSWSFGVGLVGSVVTGSGGGRFYHPTLRYWAVDRCPEQPFSGYQVRGARSWRWKTGWRREHPVERGAAILEAAAAGGRSKAAEQEGVVRGHGGRHWYGMLTSKCQALENLETKVERVPKTTRALHVVKDKGVSCAFCAGEHRISSCPKFINESTETRRNFVLKNKLCFICLLSNHSVKFCKNTLKCQVCKRRHHTLLHSQSVFGSEVGEGSSAARAESSSK
ncbi:hypothetical protein HW555_011929 [Spodoptera exigua]|uniref:Uncharacterized protein n=1 Tax=Spodoptera exigua TaxID=7107 RepID=A0A835G847_SPOEX|nr:hypothetical protein HW555_011929 [Spodoptera exigua]